MIPQQSPFDDFRDGILARPQFAADQATAAPGGDEGEEILARGDLISAAVRADGQGVCRARLRRRMRSWTQLNGQVSTQSRTWRRPLGWY